MSGSRSFDEYESKREEGQRERAKRKHHANQKTAKYQKPDAPAARGVQM